MLAEVGGMDAIFVLLGLISLGVVIWAIVDVSRQPAISPTGKAGWIIGMVLGTFLFGIVGLIVAVIYLAAMRPRLRSGG